MPEERKSLELFAGSCSFSKQAEIFNCKTFKIDWENFHNIDLVMDIEFLKTDDVPFVPDILWASPDCTTFSIAAISKHRNGVVPKSDYAKKCDRVNMNMLKIIDQLLEKNPNMIFFIENPRGMLRKMPYMKNLQRHTIWYCQYGDDRAKPTDIWTNCDNWKPRPVCKNGNRECHHQPAPRGSRTGTQGKKNSYEASKIPKELFIDIFKSIN